jgi:hypothetical protein
MHRDVEKQRETPEPRAQNAQIVVRTKPDLLDAIDKYRASQPGLPSRAEVLRRAAQVLFGRGIGTAAKKGKSGER